MRLLLGTKWVRKNAKDTPQGEAQGQSAAEPTSLGEKHWMRWSIRKLLMRPSGRYCSLRQRQQGKQGVTLN
jgi:hypothetical protein